MKKSWLNSVLVAGFVLGFWGVSANTASAQFFPQPRPGLYWNNPLMGPSYLNFNYQSSFAWSGVNPVTGPYSYGFGFSWAGTPLPGVFPFGPYRPLGPFFPYPGYGASYNYGGQGTYAGSNSSTNPVVQAQLRAFANAYNPPGGNDVEARKAAVEKFNKDAGLRGGAGEIRPPGQDDFANVPDAIIQSGKTINQLVAAIHDREAKGVKADAPLLPLDLLRHIQLSGGIPADVLTLLQAGEIQYPDAFLLGKFEMIRSQLDKPLAAVAGPLMAGKKVDPVVADRLTTTAKHVRNELKPLTNDLTNEQRATLTKFLDSVVSLADVAKNPAQYPGLVVPKWYAIGVNASEFAAILTKYKVLVAAGKAADVEAYQVLHRGLAGYLAVLPPAKQ